MLACALVALFVRDDDYKATASNFVFCAGYCGLSRSLQSILVSLKENVKSLM